MKEWQDTVGYRLSHLIYIQAMLLAFKTRKKGPEAADQYDIAYSASGNQNWDGNDVMKEW